MALKLLLVETPSVRVASVEKNKTMANENLYTAMGPVSDGQFGPPRSSSSHTSRSTTAGKVVFVRGVLAVDVDVDVIR